MERQNHSLQGLLKFAIKHTEEKKDDSTENKPMTAEEKEFLENALKSMTTDIIEQFRLSISILESDEASTERKLIAINSIRDQIDNIDFANSFVKVGGTCILMDILRNGEIQLKINAIYIIAEMCQNNPFCQQHFVDAKVIPLLVDLFAEKNEELCAAALHAVSSIVRNFDPGLVEFINIGGIHKIVQHLNTEYSRFFTKLCFVIACLSQNEDVRNEFVKQNAISRLFMQIDVVSGFDNRTETILYAISELSKSSLWIPTADNKFEMSKTLSEIVSINKELPECEEIISYSNIVLDKCK